MPESYNAAQVQKLVPYYFTLLVGKTLFIGPYTNLEVGFVRPEVQNDGSYHIYVGVYPYQLEIPELMGFSECKFSLQVFLERKGLTIPSKFDYLFK